jgi:hypothetical protein
MGLMVCQLPADVPPEIETPSNTASTHYDIISRLEELGAHNSTRLPVYH